MCYHHRCFFCSHWDLASTSRLALAFARDKGLPFFDFFIGTLESYKALLAKTSLDERLNSVTKFQFGIIVCLKRIIKIASTCIQRHSLTSKAHLLHLLLHTYRHLYSSKTTKSTVSLWTFQTRPGREIHQYLRHRTLSFHMHLTSLSSRAAGDRNQPKLLKLFYFFVCPIFFVVSLFSLYDWE